MFLRIFIIGTALLFTPLSMARDNVIIDVQSKCAAELVNLPATSTVNIEVDGDVKRFLFHNSDLANLAKSGLNETSVKEILQSLLREGALDIPSDNGGFVTAADVGDHPGNYGLYVWLRDLARVYAGTTARVRLLKLMGADASTLQKAIQVQHERGIALLKLLADTWWTHQAWANIQDPGMHLDPSKAQQSSIWVRRLATPFREDRPPTAAEFAKESDWGHRQNDALGSFALTILEGLETDTIHLTDLTPQARQNLILLSTYFVKLQYAAMWDMGAWEEQLARRTHSIGLVTSFLENLVRIFPNEAGIDYDGIRTAIDKAYELLGPRLTGERLVEADEGSVGSFRNEDTAISHLLWWTLERFDTKAHLQIIEKLDGLKRESGYARYADDWFLYGPAEVAKHFEKMGLNGLFTVQRDSERMIATPDQIDRLVRLHAQHISDKDMQEVTEIAGQNLEAQWTLPDSILSAYFSDLYMKDPKPEYLVKAKSHFLRALGLVTGHSDITSEGEKVKPYKLPEAYLPVPLIINGEVKTVYFTSPNSPLNWSTAEFTVAAEKLLQALGQSASH